MRVLVTGGAGFIGSHVVDRLLLKGCEVTVVDVLHPGAHRSVPDYLNPQADFRAVDLQDETAVKQAVARVDAICHQASMVGMGQSFDDVTDFVCNNDLGTAVLLRALEASDFRGRFVLASSMVVYGEGMYSCTQHGRTRPPPRDRERLDAAEFDPTCDVCGRRLTPEAISEDAPLQPRSIYAATKLHQEHLCALLGRERGIPVAALRYHNVYGPRMPYATPYAGVASIFRSALETGRRPEVYEDGCQLRDFIHVDDVARANVLALTSEDPVNGAYNIATGAPRSIQEMARTLASAFGDGACAPKVTGRYRLGDVRHIFASPRRSQESFGFSADVVFEDGMRAFATAPLRGSRATEA